jgi:two-component system, sensor histidine kinase
MSVILPAPPKPATVEPLRVDPVAGTTLDDDRLRIEQIAGLRAQLPVFFVNSVLFFALVMAIAWQAHDGPTLAAWFVGSVGVSALCVLAGLRATAPERVAAFGAERALRAYTALTVVYALDLTLPVWWLVPAEPLPLLAFALLNIAGLVAVPLSFTHIPATLAFGAIALGGVALRLISLGDAFSIALGIAHLVYAIPFVDAVRRGHAVFLASHQARFRNEALARRLEQSVAAELEARRAAQRADDAKTRFLAAASHDLRQPVHAGGLLAAALAAEPLPPRAASLGAQLGRTLAGLDELLGRLLDISRFDAGQVPVQPGPIEVGAIVEQVVARFAPVAERKGLALRARCGRAAWAQSDPVLLGQVLANLVSNAVRHTERGGVLVGVRRRGDSVLVEVVDTGPGIPADRRDAIFEEFVQLGDAARDRREGLGLGLAIVRRLCERLGHACEVASTPGRGSRFTVRLARLADRDPAVATDLADADPAADVAGTLVLVVDDDADVLAATDAALRTWGAETLLATTVEAAVAAVDACERWPDVILTDHRLGEGGAGLDVVRRVAEAVGQPLPSIVMSADLDETLERRVLEQGAALLRKPVDPRVLRARIADARRAAG